MKITRYGNGIEINEMHSEKLNECFSFSDARVPFGLSDLFYRILQMYIY